MLVFKYFSAWWEYSINYFGVKTQREIFVCTRPYSVFHGTCRKQHWIIKRKIRHELIEKDLRINWIAAAWCRALHFARIFDLACFCCTLKSYQASCAWTHNVLSPAEEQSHFFWQAQTVASLYLVMPWWKRWGLTSVRLMQGYVRVQSPLELLALFDETLIHNRGWIFNRANDCFSPPHSPSSGQHIKGAHYWS